MNNTEEYKNILSKILTNGDKFKGVNLLFDKMPELFDFIINLIKTTTDCSKIVANIVLNGLRINFTDLNEKAEKIEEERDEYNYLITKYRLSNIFNPEMKFYIFIEGNDSYYSVIERID